MPLALTAALAVPEPQPREPFIHLLDLRQARALDAHSRIHYRRQTMRCIEMTPVPVRTCRTGCFAVKSIHDQCLPPYDPVFTTAPLCCWQYLLHLDACSMNKERPHVS